MATSVALRAVRNQDSFAYFGDRGHWLMAIGQHRDSEALTRSNFRTVHKDLETRFSGSVAIERFNHWAVGWNESVLIDPSNVDAVNAAGDWQARLDDYPVADDDDFSDLEYGETLESIEACGLDAVMMGHSTPPESWDCPNGYRYSYTCEHCGQEIAVCSDSGSWTLPDCAKGE